MSIPRLRSVVFLMVCTAIGCNSSSDDPRTNPAAYSGTGYVTIGNATKTQTNLFAGCNGSRISAVGTIKSFNDDIWTVPAETSFTTGVKASDLFNECSGATLTNINQLDLLSVPIVTIDTDGDVIVGYLFADNYFEIYVNGTLVAVDPVPYTPFNSSVVRFKVKRPYTIGVKLVDWEENLGLGSESNNGTSYFPGDGGFIAAFSDGTITDVTWKAQTFYISPVADLGAIVEKSDGTRSSASASVSPTCNGTCYGIHWKVPDDWSLKTFDDSGWPLATIFSTQTVGVNNKLAYTNFADTWRNSSFIWSSNLKLDNLVLARKTVN